MKIAFFTDTYLPQINGVSNTLQKLGSYLTERDINYMIFAPDYKNLGIYPDNSTVARFFSISVPFYPECRLAIPNFVNLCRIADKYKRCGLSHSNDRVAGIQKIGASDNI